MFYLGQWCGFDLENVNDRHAHPCRADMARWSRGWFKCLETLLPRFLEKRYAAQIS